MTEKKLMVRILRELYLNKRIANTELSIKLKNKSRVNIYNVCSWLCRKQWIDKELVVENVKRWSSTKRSVVYWKLNKKGLKNVEYVLKNEYGDNLNESND